MKKIKVDDLLYRACVYAVADREEFLDSWGNCGEDVAEETRQFIFQLQAYMKKRWEPKNPKKE